MHNSPFAPMGAPRKRFNTPVDENGIYKSYSKDINDMLIPVECNRCGDAYDLTNVKVVHRYMDCTEYKTPCCKMRVDDREWVTSPAFTRINKAKIY